MIVKQLTFLIFNLTPRNEKGNLGSKSGDGYDEKFRKSDPNVRYDNLFTSLNFGNFLKQKNLKV